MPVVGRNDTLPLINLLQTKALEPGNHRFTVEGDLGSGVLLVENGRLVHAEYGEHQGLEAASLVLSEHRTYYMMRSGVGIGRRTMDEKCSAFLLGDWRPGSRRPKPPEPVDRSGSARVPDPSAASLFEEVLPPRVFAPEHDVAAAAQDAITSTNRSSRSGLRIHWLLLLVAVLVVAAGVAWALGARETPPSELDNESLATQSADDGVRLLRSAFAVDDFGPNDRLPELLSGEEPLIPTGTTGASLTPSVTCRILIDQEGNVVEAEIYRKRGEFETFERTALDAVRTFRFTPAQRNGTTVAVWMNWPVSFR